jgi:hypothetical protein
MGNKMGKIEKTKNDGENITDGKTGADCTCQYKI